jgi:hypothetical protein
MDFILSLTFGIILFILSFKLFDEDADVLYNTVVLLLIVTIICVFGNLMIKTLPII